MPALLRNLYLMLRWRCVIHPFADIQYPFACRIARGARIGRCTIIARGRKPISIELGAVCLHQGVILDALDGFITISDGTEINPYCVLYGTGGLRIGSQCGIGTQAVIVATSHTFEVPDIPMMSQPIDAKGVEIESDVWLGAGCRVMDGVKVAKGTVVGAGAVVTTTHPAGSVLAGVPARLVRMRPGVAA